MANATQNVLGIPISTFNLEEAVEACIERSLVGFVCFVNVHTATESTENPELAHAFKQAALLLADGMPLIWILRLKGTKLRTRPCGPDFMMKVLQNYPETPQGFIGGTSKDAFSITEKFKLKSVRVYSPPYRPFTSENAIFDWNEFLKLCPNGDVPSIVWVGLGAPKQELWMNAVSGLAPNTLFLGVGAAFDFLSGSKARAPFFMQKYGLEWAYRLLSEPKRLLSRYTKANSKFMIKLIREIIGV